MARRIRRTFRNSGEFRDWIKRLNPAFAPEEWGYQRHRSGVVEITYPLVVVTARPEGLGTAPCGGLRGLTPP